MYFVDMWLLSKKQKTVIFLFCK